MPKPETTHAPSTSELGIVGDDPLADTISSLLEPIPLDAPALVVGRRSAATMLAHILDASEDLNS